MLFYQPHQNTTTTIKSKRFVVSFSADILSDDIWLSQWVMVYIPGSIEFFEEGKVTFVPTIGTDTIRR